MRRRSDQNSESRHETLLEHLSSNCSLIVVVLFTFGFLFQNFLIPSSSMASTLLVGDHVLVERTSLAPAGKWTSLLPYQQIHRNDIVVFHKPVLDPDGEYTILVKRVIGLPGDRIHLNDGVVFLNGVAQKEPYAALPTALDGDSYADNFPALPPSLDGGVTAAWFVQLPTCVRNGDLVVPPDSYFVMGDNRERSLDSRFWGFVPRQNILGRPVIVLWSIDMPEVDDLNPSLANSARSEAWNLLHFFDKTRWTRTLHPIQ
jgi:signal peptidase I